MTIELDSEGRLAFPPEILEAVGLRPGTPLRVVLRDGHIEVAPDLEDMELVDRGGVRVAVLRTEIPRGLSASDVEDVREALRAGER